MSALQHIVFRTAEDMREVKNKSAQLVIMSPAHIMDEEFEKALLGNIFKECDRITKTSGVVAAAFGDYKRYGGTYPKHQVLSDAARDYGFAIHDHRACVWTFKRNSFFKSYYNMYVFKRADEKPWYLKNGAYPPYDWQPWVLQTSQKVLDFADAIDPEVYEMLIKKYTRKGDLVVTPFAGSGTGVIVALNLGRKAIGYELEKARKKLVPVRERQIKERTCYSPTSPIELYKKNLMIQVTVVPDGANR